MGRSESLTQTFSALCFLAAGLLFAGRVYSTINAQATPQRPPEAVATNTRWPLNGRGEQTPDRLANPSSRDRPSSELTVPRTGMVAVLPVAQRSLDGLAPTRPTDSLGEADTAVVDLSDRRVYLYQGEQLLADYAVGIGRQDWETPTGDFQVIEKQENPIWRHPFTRELVQPGPENPLGTHWVSFWTNGTHEIGFHGTNNADAIGQAVSHGCIRMRNADVEALYAMMPVGATVTVRP
ncbi:MAG: L,D-transpeptidase [Cyanobacteria bacterium P01_A01_bin.135]